ncbi:hypothetical protein HO173_003132 [Letharia columbiana]|uniref:Polysaccharide export protein n=1 Tax=Letharia columbiana TaxID=112416 RepID=A0A8H6G187_9LECA|nr:uncharacterized protein HO173_003132 [Letharia columbiana]KAF6238626.1 hypothetical protein HO173_003132 [Letharia columbiana]
MKRTSLRRFSRSSRTRVFRATLLVLALFCLIDVLSLISARQHQNLPAKTPDVRGQKIFIASIHWNNDPILRSNWNQAVLGLVDYFGAENVYVSVYESGSWDDSKETLRVLDNDLERKGVRRTVRLNETTHADEMRQPETDGWIQTPRGKTELRRIPYLSKLRNLALEPLNYLGDGTKFDRVLFLNDVVFTTEDVATLIATRDGDYSAACSLDFAKPPHYYDTFALRDDDGHEAITSTFPYFRSKASRSAMISGQPVPVQSCWNGIVAFDAAPFYDPHRLKFRGVSDSLALHHVEGSECCLIHADNPLTQSHGVWLNPNVRVGYSPEAYAAVKSALAWPSMYQSLLGIWSNRLWRWTTSTKMKSVRITSRLKSWSEDGADRSEPGMFCLINEMQVLIENGWAHV